MQGQIIFHHKMTSVKKKKVHSKKRLGWFNPILGQIWTKCNS